jgi:outer membrane lipoprotein carrier protein
MSLMKRFVALLLLCCAQVALSANAGGDTAAGRQKVEGFLQGLQSLQAHFKQTLSDRAGQVVEQASGELAIRRPDRFRWDYQQPNKQVIVADGTRIWLYDSDLEQVTVRKLDATLSATPAMLLSGQGNLQDNFTVVQSSEEAVIQWVRMEPKRDDTDFKWVRLGFDGATLKFMQLADKLGQITTLEFSQLQRNPAIDSSLFTFTVPAGADVIGDAPGRK